MQRHTVIQVFELQSELADDNQESRRSGFPQGRVFPKFRWGRTIVLQLDRDRVRLSNSV
jgi:hypothetical protein